MQELSRRYFLSMSGRAFAFVAVAGTAAGAGLVAGCDPRELSAPDGNGLRLQQDFVSRRIATTGLELASTGYLWHTAPDGGACFPMPDGGWSYVSNSETSPGGASYVRFAVDGTILGAGRCLSDTVVNCAGGATPWGTWLSCEEVPSGHVWECDPTGATDAVVRLALGTFTHEAIAVDVANHCLYLTEDRPDGALYRFLPATWGDLGSGALQVLVETSGELTWVTVPEPNGVPIATRNQIANTKRFNGGEGAAMSRGRLVFTTKGDNRLWAYDPAAGGLSIIYDDDVQVNGVLSGVDNVGVSKDGTIYVAEDGGNMQIVLVRNDGSTFAVVEVTGVSGSEITGPAFDPSGARLYFSSQRNPGMTFEVMGPWSRFTD